MKETYPIPGTINLCIAACQLVALVSLLAAGAWASGWWLVAVMVGYGLVMNSAYAMLHEAEHNLLHDHRIVNQSVGAILALFFPAPFHLLRQGHLGHHMRNRSDDEAFDFYFEGDNPLWKRMQLYGILTGFFWLVIALSNALALLNPQWLGAKKLNFDRPTVAVQESLNPKYLFLIRLEALAIFVLHGSLIWFWQIPIWKYALILGGFGAMWSALQYVHHFGTVRDVQKGALNLKTFFLLDWLWLNHNWHLNHHLQPTVPWIYLPRLAEAHASRGRLSWAYLRMWQGPRFTRERVQNRYAGKIIK